MSDDTSPPAGSPTPRVRQLRLVVTAEDYEAAVAFYRDALGLPELGAFTDPDGRVVILDAGRATLEITDPPHAAYVDRVEGVDRDTDAGRRAGATAGTSGPRVRVAFEVTDAHGATRRLESAGAHVVAEPVRTPWDSLNARLDGPADLELTVFQELGDPDVPPSADY
jgi:catechol 2,3-dioxygenase-like lactoylglutathione lyase family enzyme